MYLQEDEPSSIVMVRLDKSDSRCGVRLKSMAEVYSGLTANGRQTGSECVAEVAVAQVPRNAW